MYVDMKVVQIDIDKRLSYDKDHSLDVSFLGLDDLKGTTVSLLKMQ